jgi:hypothetical protein
MIPILITYLYPKYGKQSLKAFVPVAHRPNAEVQELVRVVLVLTRKLSGTPSVNVVQAVQFMRVTRVHRLQVIREALYPVKEP